MHPLYTFLNYTGRLLRYLLIGIGMTENGDNDNRMIGVVMRYYHGNRWEW